MFPSHCKEVSVKTVDFPLDEENILGFLSGARAYIRTKYFVFNSAADWAVATVEKSGRNGVLQPITSAQVVALPEETTFVDDPSLEVLSASRMGRLRRSKGTKCVVVRGRSEHISFFVEEEPFKLTIFDVVPPAPSKLVGLVDAALEDHLQDAYVEYESVEVDINGLADVPASDTVVYPCRASGLGGAGPVIYLDETPNLDAEVIAGSTLVGCSLSCRIFESVYGVRPRGFTNMCPVDLLDQAGISGPVLVKCCKVKQGVEMKGEVAIVPWGARVSDVSAALESLIQKSRSSSRNDVTGH
jgi:hypothetical protein